MLTYIKGDLFKNLPQDNFVIPHIVNTKGAWGAGFVVPLGMKYSEAREQYIANWKACKLGVTQKVEVGNNCYVANMFAQTLGEPKPIRYAALEKCMKDVALLCKRDKLEIHAPKFGSGLAGGSWPYIESLIEKVWKDIKVTIYEI